MLPLVLPGQVASTAEVGAANFSADGGHLGLDFIDLILQHCGLPRMALCFNGGLMPGVTMEGPCTRGVTMEDPCTPGVTMEAVRVRRLG